MKQVYPDYYHKFVCTAGGCRHSCCIGWEIDIDSDTAAAYASMPGALGAQLRQHIAWDAQPPHFILGEGERCPFLNGHNLCDLILAQGEDILCDICHQHPRFHNELPGRVESGLGLCCEAAGALILGQAEPMRLMGAEDIATQDEIIALRDEVIAILQDRRYYIPTRVQRMLRRCGTDLPERSIPEWAEFLLSLERLEDGWTAVLEGLRDRWHAADRRGFDAYMSTRQTEYEQFLVYLVYRHMANAPDMAEAAARATFAALGYFLLQEAGAVQWTETGSFTPEDQVELARLFSAEIEYSDENMYLILEELY